MPERYTQQQYDDEHALFSRSPRWELNAIKRALNSFSWDNTSQQWARLAAVTDLLREKKGR